MLFRVADYEHKWWNRELILKCKLQCYVKPMKNPLGVSPKGNQGTTGGKEKIRTHDLRIRSTVAQPFFIPFTRAKAQWVLMGFT